jgi:hypothetical protein
VKKDRIRATRFSVVVLMPLNINRGIVTSPHALIGVSKAPARTISLSATRVF